MENDRLGAPKFSPSSEANSRSQPGRTVFSSRGAGWSSLLLEVFESSGSADAFETVPTPDQVIVLLSKGGYPIESFSSGSWKKADYRPGAGGMTSAMNTSRLRWHSPASQVTQTLHLYIPQSYFHEAAEEHRCAGTTCAQPPDTLLFSDSLVFSTAKCLTNQAAAGVPDLYADAAARFLAVHLLSECNRWSDRLARKRIGQDLNDRRLRRVLEFMQARFREPLTLDRLAREAGVSRFHFARLFHGKLRSTPHRYLVRLRMHHAQALLGTTDLSIAEIALQCGYVHTGHFAAAFQQRFAVSPSTYRRRLYL